MENHITKIKKVEIKGLWNRFDLSWTLNPDVNVLSGINGSGKSTILRSIVELVTTGALKEVPHVLIKRIEVIPDHRESLIFVAGKPKNKEKNSDKENSNESPANLMEFLITSGMFNKNKPKVQIWNKHLKIDIINTFDNELSNVKPDEMVRTTLDRDIFRLQKKYLDYQLNISKKKDLIVDEPTIIDIKKAIQALRQPHNRFLEIIDDLFSITDKKINRHQNEIMFTYDKEELTPYQLSSGEKQILVILLTVLVQDHRNSILFMDEPEISLHFDWQKKLIQYIRELNPNVQIILATHSPAVIMEGWLDKVFEVSDLVTPIKTNAKK